MYLLGVYSSPPLPVHAAVGKQGQVTELSTRLKTLIPKNRPWLRMLAACPSPPVEDSMMLFALMGRKAFLQKRAQVLFTL